MRTSHTYRAAALMLRTGSCLVPPTVTRQQYSCCVRALVENPPHLQGSSTHVAYGLLLRTRHRSAPSVMRSVIFLPCHWSRGGSALIRNTFTTGTAERGEACERDKGGQRACQHSPGEVEPASRVYGMWPTVCRLAPDRVFCSHQTGGAIQIKQEPLCRWVHEARNAALLLSGGAVRGMLCVCAQRPAMHQHHSRTCMLLEQASTSLLRCQECSTGKPTPLHWPNSRRSQHPQPCLLLCSQK